MRFEVRGVDAPLDLTTRDYVLRRMAFSLERFSTRIDAVSVSLRGGDGTLCHIRVRGHRAGPSGDVHTALTWSFTVREWHVDPRVAIDSAFARANRSVARRLGRSHDRTRTVHRIAL